MDRSVTFCSSRGVTTHGVRKGHGWTRSEPCEPKVGPDPTEGLESETTGTEFPGHTG